MRYAERVVRRHDTNGDGRVDAEEWQAMQGQPATADVNGDGQLTVEEFARHLATYGSGRRIRLSKGGGQGEPQPATEAPNDTAIPANALDRQRDTKFVAPVAGGTPGWFIERDTDGDAQLTLSEFSPRLRATEVAEFNRYDLNGDGLLTPAELAKATSKAAATGPTGTPATSQPPSR